MITGTGISDEELKHCFLVLSTEIKRLEREIADKQHELADFLEVVRHLKKEYELDEQDKRHYRSDRT